MATKPKQYVETMEEAYSYVQKEWESSGRALLGTRGFCAVHVQSVRKSHPALPIFMNALAGLVISGGIQWSNASALGIQDATCFVGGEHQLLTNSEVWTVCNC